MEIFVLIFVLLLFWLYIRWDGERIAVRAQSDAKQRPRGAEYFPRAVITVPSLLIASAALAATAAVLMIHPPMPPFTGRGSWIIGLIHAVLGHYGPALAVITLALTCVAGAMACIKKGAA